MFNVITDRNRIIATATLEAAQFEADLVTESGFAAWALVTDHKGNRITRHTARSVTFHASPVMIPV